MRKGWEWSSFSTITRWMRWKIAHVKTRDVADRLKSAYETRKLQSCLCSGRMWREQGNDRGVCTVGVKTTDHCPRSMDSQKTRATKNRRGWKSYKWKVQEQDTKRNSKSFEKRLSTMQYNSPYCWKARTRVARRDYQNYSKILRAVGKRWHSYYQQGRNHTETQVIKGWEQLVKTIGSSVREKKRIECNGAVIWWGG